MTYGNWPNNNNMRNPSLHFISWVTQVVIVACNYPLSAYMKIVCGSVNSELQTICVSSVWSFHNQLFTMHHSGLIYGTTIPTSFNILVKCFYTCINMIALPINLQSLWRRVRACSRARPLVWSASYGGKMWNCGLYSSLSSLLYWPLLSVSVLSTTINICGCTGIKRTLGFHDEYYNWIFSLSHIGIIVIVVLKTKK